MTNLSPARITAFLVVALATAGGCSGGDARPAPPAIDAVEPFSLAFEPSASLAIGPGQTEEVVVLVTPPVTGTRLRLALVGDPADAAVEPAVSAIDDSGRARFILYAPTRSATFRLRATADDTPVVAPASRDVTVDGAGFGTVMVTLSNLPVRPVTNWRATRLEATTCSALAGPPFGSDGPSAVSAAPLLPILVDIPVGMPSAITLQGDGVVGGCADVTNLVVGERRRVGVTVANVPLRVTNAPLAATLAVAPSNASEWARLTLAWRDRFATAFTAESPAQSRWTPLLEAMSETVAASDKASFQGERASFEAVLAEPSVTVASPSVALKAWLDVADGVLASPGPVTGVVTLTPTGSETFAARTLFGLPAPAGGRETVTSLTFSNNNETDGLLVGGSVTFSPSRLLARACALGIAGDASADLAGRVRELVDCGAVAQTITDGRPFAFGACTSDCARAVCEKAVVSMWGRAVGSDELAGRFDVLTFNVVARVTFSSDARLTGWSGVFVGAVGDGGMTSALLAQGAASAVVIPTAP